MGREAVKSGVSKRRVSLALNPRQRVLLALAAALVVMLLLFPPWRAERSGANRFLGFHSLFAAPPPPSSPGENASWSVGVHVPLATLLLAELALAALLAALAAGDGRREPEKPRTHPREFEAQGRDFSAILAPNASATPRQEAPARSSPAAVFARSAPPIVHFPAGMIREKGGAAVPRIQLVEEVPDAPGAGLVREIGRQVDRLSAAGRVREAERLLDKALGLALRGHGRDHPLVGLLLARRARWRADHGSFAGAEDDYIAGLEVLSAVLKPDHPVFAMIYSDYAGLLRRTGRGKAADALESLAEGRGAAPPAPVRLWLPRWLVAPPEVESRDEAVFNELLAEANALLGR